MRTVGCFLYSAFAKGNLGSRFDSSRPREAIPGIWESGPVDEDELSAIAKDRVLGPGGLPSTPDVAVPPVFSPSDQVLEWLENLGLQRARPRPGPVAWMGLPLDTQSSSYSESLGYTKLCKKWTSVVGSGYSVVVISEMWAQ